VEVPQAFSFRAQPERPKSPCQLFVKTRPIYLALLLHKSRALDQTAPLAGWQLPRFHLTEKRPGFLVKGEPHDPMNLHQSGKVRCSAVGFRRRSLDLIESPSVKHLSISENGGIVKAATIVGILLIAIGIVGFALGGISFTHEKKDVDLGPLQISHKQTSTLPISPILSALSLVAGVGLVVVGVRRR
jgi:hypothetical protein